MCSINSQIFNIRFVYKTSRQHVSIKSEVFKFEFLKFFPFYLCFSALRLITFGLLVFPNIKRLKHNIILGIGITRHIKCNTVPCAVVAGRRAVDIENPFKILK